MSAMLPRKLETLASMMMLPLRTTTYAARPSQRMESMQKLHQCLVSEADVLCTRLGGVKHAGTISCGVCRRLALCDLSSKACRFRIPIRV